MENQERRVDSRQVLEAIRLLRSVTNFIKIAPFVYAMMFILCMLVYLFCDDNTSSICDMLFYISPITSITFVCLSFKLKLCNWYRLQCLIPLMPLPFSIVDGMVCEFIEPVAYINYGITSLAFILSLLNAYFVFVKK